MTVISPFPSFKTTSPYYPIGADCVMYHTYWGGTTLDHSTHGNDGTNYGAVFGPNGLTFNGSSDYVDCGSSADFKSNYVSCFVWVKRDATGAYNGIVGWTDSWTRGWQLYADTRNGYPADPYNAFVNSYTGGGVVGAEVKTVLRVHSPEEWNCLQFVFDGSVARLYINGVLRQENPYSGVINWAGISSTFQVGKRTDGGGAYFSGTIGEVLVFDAAKTYQECFDYYKFGYSRYSRPGTAITPSYDSVGASCFMYLPFWSGLTKDQSPVAIDWESYSINDDEIECQEDLGLAFISPNYFYSGLEPSTLSASHKPANLTVHAWINLSSVPGYYVNIVGCVESGGWQKGWRLTLLNGKMNSSINVYNGAGVVVETDPFVYSAWVLYSMTYDGSTLTLYKNGVSTGTPVAYGTGIDYTGITSKSLYNILNLTGSSGSPSGYVGEVRGYNVAHDSSTVLSYFNSTKARYGL